MALQKVDNLELPLQNDYLWSLFEDGIKKKTTGHISPEMQSELIDRMKIFNKRMISIVADFSQKNTKYFTRHQKEKIRENLQSLINDIYFNRIQLELENQMLKKDILDKFVSAGQ